MSAGTGRFPTIFFGWVRSQIIGLGLKSSRGILLYFYINFRLPQTNGFKPECYEDLYRLLEEVELLARCVGCFSYGILLRQDPVSDSDPLGSKTFFTGSDLLKVHRREILPPFFLAKSHVWDANGCLCPLF